MPSVSKKRRVRLGDCTYCGFSGAVTDDHVPAKNLFPSPRPSDLITVPSCARCNAGASKDDEYFRNAVLSIAELANHPQAAKLIPTEQRALARPEKRATAAAFEQSLREVEVLSAEGIYLGKGQMREVQTSRLCRVASRIVRGLYFRTQGRALPREYLATAIQAPGYLPDDIAQKRKQLDQRLAHEIATLQKEAAVMIGDGVFSYCVVIVDAAEHQSKWLLEFYGLLRFVVLTDHASKSKASTHKHTFPACLDAQ